MAWSAIRTVIALGGVLISIGIGGIYLSSWANAALTVAKPALNATAGIDIPADQVIDPAPFWVFFGVGFAIIILGGVMHMKQND